MPDFRPDLRGPKPFGRRWRLNRSPAAATAAHLGRSTQVWDAVTTHGGRTIALYRCTQMVLYPKADAPAGRG